MTTLLGLLVIAAAIYAILRQVDVRLALLLAALALGTLGGKPMAIVETFLATLSREQFVVPICTAMGFAYVLRHTECDQHLVQLLVTPLRRVRGMFIPGAVLVGFLVNIPVISQTSTAVAIGAVLVPLLRAARVSPVTTGAALLLGSSIGGELLNPGAPELRTISTALGIDSRAVVVQVVPLVLVQVCVTTPLFWLLSSRAEASSVAEPASPQTMDIGPVPRIRLDKALVPLVPLGILFLTGPPLQLVTVPSEWLVKTDPPSAAELQNFGSRLIGAAMLVGVALAALITWKAAAGTARAFFEGAGYAFTHIISLIVTASCFGEGVKQIGLAAQIGAGITAWPDLLLPVAGALPLAFAWISGSGMAATQSLFEFFISPARSLGIDAAQVGAIVALGAAAGRTLSPVAAVTLMSAALTETKPSDLIRRAALPVLVGLTVVVLIGFISAAHR